MKRGHLVCPLLVFFLTIGYLAGWVWFGLLAGWKLAWSDIEAGP